MNRRSRQIQDPVDAWPTSMMEREGITRQATKDEIRRAIKTGRPVYKRVTRQVTKKEVIKVNEPSP